MVKLFSTTLLVSIFVLGCGKSRPEEPTDSCSTPSTFYETAAPLFSFADNSSAEALVNQCIFSPNQETYCGLQSFPLLGSKVKSVTVEDVLANTFVTHRWMKERCREP